MKGAAVDTWKRESVVVVVVVVVVRVVVCDVVCRRVVLV
jgi:hypothetical protein